MIKYSKQSTIDTQATINGQHFAWISKVEDGYTVTIKGQPSLTSFAASMKEAKDYVKTLIDIA